MAQVSFLRGYLMLLLFLLEVIEYIDTPSPMSQKMHWKKIPLEERRVVIRYNGKTCQFPKL